MSKVLLAARLNHVCVNSLQQVYLPDIIVNLLSIYSSVIHTGGTAANDADYIAKGQLIEAVSCLFESFSN